MFLKFFFYFFLGPGPENWPGICTTGTFQSPINIQSQNTTEIEEKPFIFHGYDVTPKNAEISNNGHTVGITFENQRISVKYYLLFQSSIFLHTSLKADPD